MRKFPNLISPEVVLVSETHLKLLVRVSLTSRALVIRCIFRNFPLNWKFKILQETGIKHLVMQINFINAVNWEWLKSFLRA